MYDQKQQTKSGVSILVRVLRKLAWVAIKIKQKISNYVKKFLKFIFPIIDKYIEKQELDNIIKLNFGTGSINKNNKYKIGLVIRDGKTYPKSSAFIRLISPLSNKSVDSKISFEIYNENVKKLPEYINVCIVQRTALNNVDDAENLLKNIKKNHIKLIVDVDDAFGFIDKDHSEHSVQGETYAALHFLIKNADQVWVSTKELKKMYLKENKNVYIIENTLDERLWRSKPKIDHKKNNLLNMLYMGTATHDNDLKIILRALDKLQNKHKNKFKLTVIGVTKDSLPEKEWIERIYQPRGGSIYPKFVSWFREQGPFDIGFCPLVQNEFNNYKSDIKCLDYLGAGIYPVVSDVKAYKNPDLDEFIIKIKNEDKKWIDAIDKILSNKKSFLQKKEIAIENGQRYLWEKRSCEKASKEILDKLDLL